MTYATPAHRRRRRSVGRARRGSRSAISPAWTPSVAEPGPAAAVTVIRERLGGLGVPILGGLPVGHAEDQVWLPLGVPATLDTYAGTPTAESVVC